MIAGTTSSMPNKKMYCGIPDGWSYCAIVLVISVLFLNLSVLFKILPLELFTLYPSNIEVKQWWRIITHLFVHSDACHFILDFFIFIVLYLMLHETMPRKMIYLIIIAMAVTISCIMLSKYDWVCGLSGLNYGLFTMICCMDSSHAALRGSSRTSLTLILLISIVAKTSIELIAMLILDQNIYYPFFGYISSESHAGGIIGGLICYLHWRRAARFSAIVPPLSSSKVCGVYSVQE